MKSINNLSLVKNIIEHVTRMRVLRRPKEFLSVRFSICVRCNILILLTKLFVVEFIRCSIPHCVCVCVCVCTRVYIYIYIVTGHRIGVFVRQS